LATGDDGVATVVVAFNEAINARDLDVLAGLVHDGPS